MFIFSALDTLVYWQEGAHPQLSLCSTQFAIKAAIFLHHPISPGISSGGAQKQRCAEECLKCHTWPASSGKHKNTAETQQNGVRTFAHATGKCCPYCFLLKKKSFLIAGLSHVYWDSCRICWPTWKAKPMKGCVPWFLLKVTSPCQSETSDKKSHPFRLLSPSCKTREEVKMPHTTANGNYWPLRALFQVTVINKTTVAT